MCRAIPLPPKFEVGRPVVDDHVIFTQKKCVCRKAIHRGCKDALRKTPFSTEKPARHPCLSVGDRCASTRSILLDKILQCFPLATLQGKKLSQECSPIVLKMWPTAAGQFVPSNWGCRILEQSKDKLEASRPRQDSANSPSQKKRRETADILKACGIIFRF